MLNYQWHACQGAGGNGNVLKEIVDPLGGKFQIRSIHSGDETLSALELWGAEYQENCALLLRPESRKMFEVRPPQAVAQMVYGQCSHFVLVYIFQALCRREQCPASFVGEVSGDGRVLVMDDKEDKPPVDLPLSLVLGDLPPKKFESRTVAPVLKPLAFPEPMQVQIDSILNPLSKTPKPNHPETVLLALALA